MTGLRRITALIPGGATGDTAAPLAISETALVAGASTFTIAGELIGALYAGCTIVSANGLECVQQQFFQHYRALTRAEVALGGTLRNQASASPTVDIAPRALGPLSTPRSIDGFSYGTSEIALPPGF
jgi:hypothetical protein